MIGWTSLTAAILALTRASLRGSTGIDAQLVQRCHAGVTRRGSSVREAM
jgi:hypothetical protein